MSAYKHYSVIKSNSAAKLPQQTASMANSLYHSLQGQYFVGYADGLHFSENQIAWAALVNPIGSGINLFVNVWTVTNFHQLPLRVRIWFNSNLPGDTSSSSFVTPSNFTLTPLPQSKIELLQASDVSQTPFGGVIAYERIAPSVETQVAEEDGKFILPPGGNIAIVLSHTEGDTLEVNAQIAFGWWNQKLCRKD